MLAVHFLKDLRAQHIERFGALIRDVVGNNPARFQTRRVQWDSSNLRQDGTGAEPVQSRIHRRRNRKQILREVRWLAYLRHCVFPHTACMLYALTRGGESRMTPITDRADAKANVSTPVLRQ